jgi:hypothetical protein
MKTPRETEIDRGSPAAKSGLAQLRLNGIPHGLVDTFEDAKQNAEERHGRYCNEKGPGHSMSCVPALMRPLKQAGFYRDHAPMRKPAGPAEMPTEPAGRAVVRPAVARMPKGDAGNPMSAGIKNAGQR